MENPQVTVRIDKSGKAIMNIEGIEGPSCAEYTAALLRNMPNGEVVEHKQKDEFYAEVEEDVEAGF